MRPSSADRSSVLAVALSLNLILVENRVVQDLVRIMQEWIASPAAFMVLVNLLLLVVGCLMDINSAILVLAPLLAPLAAAYGYDKIVFG
jgi:C4-dicarboxylate transporter DctM subunit